MRCVRCYSYAINHAQHGRDGSDGDLCDVCYWRARAEYPAAPAPVAPTQAEHDAAIRQIQDAFDDDNASVAQPDSVTSIMLDVVPGPDGMGAEIYAKSVNDVMRKLTEMGQRIEELESRTAAARVPLTDEQIDAIIGRDPAIVRYPFVLARAIERAHGIEAAVQEGGAA